MPVFQYGPGYVSPYANTIAQLIAHQADARADAAQQIAAANARASEVSGQAWGNTVQGITNAATGALQTIQQERLQAPIRAMQQLQLQQAQREQQAQQATALIMRGDQLAPGAAGPRLPNYLNEDGTADLTKVTAGLNAMGLGDQAPSIVKAVALQNEAMLQVQKQQDEVSKRQTIRNGTIANTTLQLMNSGFSIDQAMDAAAQGSLVNKSIKPDDYAKIRTHILSLPPEQQQAGLEALRDQAADAAGLKTYKEGEQGIDIFDRVRVKAAKPLSEWEAKLVAAGVIPGQTATPAQITQEFKVGRPETELTLAEDLSSADPAVRDHAKATLAAVAAQKRATAPRSETDKELDAYAASIGKPNAESLTYQDRQTFEQNKENIRSNTAFQQHMRERAYDAAHPVEKPIDQNKLEQQYRTVLLRAVSARSGGLGLEDQKVDQANHLVAAFVQAYDPKTGTYNMSPTTFNETALGLAKLMSQSGNVGVELMKEVRQRTAKGDLAGALTYITGTPFSGSTQDVYKNLLDSIQRQGETAVSNREAAMGYLRGLAPTDLEESRREALERTGLVNLQQMRIVQNDKTKQTFLQTSTDGGKTWR